MINTPNPNDFSRGDKNCGSCCYWVRIDSNRDVEIGECTEIYCSDIEDEVDVTINTEVGDILTTFYTTEDFYCALYKPERKAPKY